jgi:HAD superfamily hydrolase (TIGR01509 family)
MLLIFDCDGVLVDSESLSCQLDAELLTEFGVPYTAEDVAREFIGVSLKDQIARIEVSHGISLPHDFSERLNRRLFARFETDLKPIAGVREAILALPYSRCVASSSVPERIALSLRITGLSDLFDHVFSATQVARGKPAPDLFLHAAARMGVNPQESIVIEDSTAGVQAALAARMRVIGFSGGSHCGPEHAEKLRLAGASVVVDQMKDLSEAVELLKKAIVRP